VGGTGQHHFAGTSFEPQKLPENAQTPHGSPGVPCPGCSVLGIAQDVKGNFLLKPPDEGGP